MYMLGEVSPDNIQKSAKEIIIKDYYDFNDGVKDRKELVKSLFSTIGDLPMGKASLYSVIRKAVSLRHTTGYKGFPVSFKLDPTKFA